jgi:hypothetical protein
MNNTNNPAKAVIKAKRIKYGFELNFPNEFTIRDLVRAKRNTVKYITLHSRVKRAIEEGTVIEAGLKEPTHTRRGRKETIYRLVQEAPVATAEVATPSATGW